MWRIDPNGLMRPLLETEFSEPYNMPRQALPEVYWQTGYVDTAWAKTIINKNSMTGEKILPLVIDPSEWIDIDSPDDWRRAERLLEGGEVTFEDLGFRVEESCPPSTSPAA
jgi:N-acylneuraminate cytidylyltransferase